LIGWLASTGRCDRRRATALVPVGIDAIRALGGTWFSMKGMILFVTGLGIVFLASAVQTFGTNWLGQVCPRPGPCFHPEWLAVGVGLSVAAYIAWKVDRKRH
jgi:hypothetical protein